MTKNLRSTVKNYAHLQTLTQTRAKFQKDQANIVGGVEFTNVDTFCDGQTDRGTE